MKREKKRYSSERFLVSLLIRTNVGGSSKVFTSELSRVVIARLLTEGAALVSRVRAVRASRLKNSRCALLSPSSPLVGSALDRPRRPGRASESEKYFNTVWRNSRKRLNPRDEVRGIFERVESVESSTISKRSGKIVRIVPKGRTIFWILRNEEIRVGKCEKWLKIIEQSVIVDC